MATTRYFKDGPTCWKFQAGERPLIRTLISRAWVESGFASLEDFLADPEEVEEITAEEAEIGFGA